MDRQTCKQIVGQKKGLQIFRQTYRYATMQTVMQKIGRYSDRHTYHLQTCRQPDRQKCRRKTDIYAQTDRKTYRPPDTQTYIQIYRQSDMQTGRHADSSGQTDSQAKRQTYQHSERETDMQRVSQTDRHDRRRGTQEFKKNLTSRTDRQT